MLTFIQIQISLHCTLHCDIVHCDIVHCDIVHCDVVHCAVQSAPSAVQCSAVGDYPRRLAAITCPRHPQATTAPAGEDQLHTTVSLVRHHCSAVLLQCTVTVVQCTVTVVQCTLTAVQCTVTVVQCTVTVVQCTGTIVQCTVTSVQSVYIRQWAAVVPSEEAAAW